MSPDKGSIAKERDRYSEFIESRTVTGPQFRLHEARIVKLEQVRRAGTRAIIIVPSSPDKSSIARERDRFSKSIVCPSIAGRQLGNLHPIRTIKLEQIRRAGSFAIIVVQGRAYKGSIAEERYRPSEFIACRTVASRQLSLDHVPTIKLVYVGRPGIIVITTCPHDSTVPIDGRGPSKIIARRCVTGCYLQVFVHLRHSGQAHQHQQHAHYYVRTVS